MNEKENALEHPKKHHLAARMARWSAHHRKIAIFGWLGFVIVIVRDQHVRRHPAADRLRDVRPGESGRADTILYEDFKQPAGESILIQHPELMASDIRRSGRSCSPSSTGVESLDAVAKVESPFDAENNSGQISDDQHSVLVAIEIAGASGRRDRQDRSGRRPGQGGAEGEPGLHHRILRREHREGGPGGVLRRSDEGRGSISIPLTLIILLVAFGALVAAGIPLLLGLTAVLGDDGPRRDHQPGAADVRRRRRDHPADRARRRCRLHDVLFEAGARGACRGPERRGCARGGGGDVGPLGADLRTAPSSSPWRACSSPSTPASPRSALRR